MIKKLIPNSLKHNILGPARRELGAFFVDIGLSILKIKDPFVPPTRMDFVGGSDFKATGYEFLRYFTEFANLQPQDSVLDIGCGIGRMALPLANYLRTGRYEGIDIVPKGIEWCQSNITPRFPNFHYQIADIYNKFYNPRGIHKASEYKFPYPDETFDFVFLTSVFTHMLPLDTENYLREITRTLKKGGRTLITWFILNSESRNLMEKNSKVMQLNLNFGEQSNIRVLDTYYPENAVGYEEDYVARLYASNNLQINHPKQFGNWCARSEFTSFQDIIVATK